MKYLDTRDLYKRQCELQEELEALEEAVSEAEEEYNAAASDYREAIPDEDIDDAQEYMEKKGEELSAAHKKLEDWKEEYQEELDELNRLENEIRDGWMHGETLIPEEEFKNYAMDLADDLHGSAVRDAAWPFDCIDWDQAADELRTYYSSVEYQGDTFLFRV